MLNEQRHFIYESMYSKSRKRISEKDRYNKEFYKCLLQGMLQRLEELKRAIEEEVKIPGLSKKEHERVIAGKMQVLGLSEENQKLLIILGRIPSNSPSFKSLKTYIEAEITATKGLKEEPQVIKAKCQKLGNNFKDLSDSMTKVLRTYPNTSFLESIKKWAGETLDYILGRETSITKVKETAVKVKQTRKDIKIFNTAHWLNTHAPQTPEWSNRNRKKALSSPDLKKHRSSKPS